LRFGNGVAVFPTHARLFAYIAQNWRGKPLVSHQGIVQLIGSTTTETGLKFCCEIDGNLYPKGVKVSDQELAELNIKGNAFHPEWNYTISPNQQPPWSSYFRSDP
jgi:DDE family transposase